MPNWLSKDADRALRAAEREANARRQVVGTPHLLLGLIAEETATPVKVLRSMGFSVSEVRVETARKLGRLASGRTRRRRPDYSTRAEAILSRALAEARRNERDVVEPEDLLVAIVTEPDGRAAEVLNRLRADARLGSDGTDGRVPVTF